MRMKIYNFLVNKHSGISYKYHSVHDSAPSNKRLYSYLYLLGLNAKYYLLHDKSLDYPQNFDIYEELKISDRISQSEKAKTKILSAEKLVKYLSKYDVISFDIFDTLIFRPFSKPSDLFYILGNSMDIMDFKRIREEQEYLSRLDKEKKSYSQEVNLKEIWQRIEKETGISSEYGLKKEQDTELDFCYANPYMLYIFSRLKSMGKCLIATSDIYFNEKFLTKLLNNNGYNGFKKLFISCEQNCSKSDGKIYKKIKKFFKNKSIIHVGDNITSDINNAKNKGLSTFHYPNTDLFASKYLAHDMSPIIGSSYRGIVSKRLYNGMSTYPIEYEYGYLYGGLFVLGYCHFIHNYSKKNNIEKIVFLARDGDILKQIYEKLYPNDNISYLLWSRAVGTKLMFSFDRYDFFRRFIYHKVNKNIKISDILKDMGLCDIEKYIKKYINTDNKLTNKNSDYLKNIIIKHSLKVEECFSNLNFAAKEYLSGEFKNIKKACVVDIGWAGSGAVSISKLTKEWNINCKIIGLIAGTNTIHNAEPDATEINIQTGQIVAYMYSQAHNRDLMKKHNPSKYYNIFWEILLSSKQRQLKSFKINKNKEIIFVLGKKTENQLGIERIQRGIKDFVSDYMHHFKKYPYMLNISGRDAYAPLLSASGHNEKYLRKIAEKFNMDLGV